MLSPFWFSGLSVGGSRLVPAAAASSWVEAGSSPVARSFPARSFPAPAPAVLPAGVRVLRSFGVESAPFAVVFAFRWRGAWAAVVSRVASRREAARLLRRLRAARRAVLAARLPRSAVWGAAFPRFCLRWLACRPLCVGVFSSSGLIGRRVRPPSAWRLRFARVTVPAGLPAECLAPAPSPAPAPARAGEGCPPAWEADALRALDFGLACGFAFAPLAGAGVSPSLAARAVEEAGGVAAVLARAGLRPRG